MMTPSSVLIFTERGSQLKDPTNNVSRSTTNAFVCSVANSAPHAVEQSEALGELGTYATPESVMAIESALYRITDPEVRLRAINALGNIAAMDVDTGRIRDILEIMADSGTNDVAVAARNTISRIPGPEY